MYCANCGQAQVVEDARFCSRCGFSLVEVRNILERLTATDLPRKPKAPTDRSIRRAMYFLAAVLPLLFLAILTAAAEMGGVPELFLLLSIFAYIIGIVRLAYLALIKRRRDRSTAAPMGQPTSQVEAPPHQALPPRYEPPVDISGARYETGEHVEPPSVTEHTTRHMEREPPRSRER